MTLKFVAFNYAGLIFHACFVGMSSARFSPEEVFFGELCSSDEEVEDSFDCDEILPIDATWEEDR